MVFVQGGNCLRCISQSLRCYCGGDSKEGLLLSKDILGNTTAMKDPAIRHLGQEILMGQEGHTEHSG